MSVPKSLLQSDAHGLFRYYHEDMDVWINYIFEEVLDQDNIKKVSGEPFLFKLEEINNILCEIKEDLESDSVQYMKSEEGELCKIFDMGQNLIEDKWCIYDYDIDEYKDMIMEKIMEYKFIEKKIEEEKAKIQMEKYVRLGVALALSIL
jgi:hypothetical protein